MKTVLIVSPHFPPANTADMHRVRMILPFLRDMGWLAQVLAVDPKCLTSPRDPWLLSGLPADVPVHYAAALGLEYCWIPGLRKIDFRCRRALRRMGDELLTKHRFDLIYFSTVVFGIVSLGRRWKRKFGVPFVLDYQDPWVSDYYRENPDVVPPGGRVKFEILDFFNRVQEPRVLKDCAGITSVSPAYPRQLNDRYPHLAPLQCAVLPFPGSSRDIDRIRQGDILQRVFDPKDGNRHWVYVGRGGPDMEFTLTGLFMALRKWKSQSPEEYQRTRLHFIGTSYSAPGGGVAAIRTLAEKLELNDIVRESTDRIPFSAALKCITEADALIVPGSNDPAYTASKLYPYLLARKPLLGIFHQESSVTKTLREVGGGHLVAFDGNTAIEQLADEISDKWFARNGFETLISLDETRFEPYSDRESARQLCQFFDSIIGDRIPASQS